MAVETVPCRSMRVRRMTVSAPLLWRMCSAASSSDSNTESDSVQHKLAISRRPEKSDVPFREAPLHSLTQAGLKLLGNPDIIQTETLEKQAECMQQMTSTGYTGNERAISDAISDSDARQKWILLLQVSSFWDGCHHFDIPGWSPPVDRYPAGEFCWGDHGNLYFMIARAPAGLDKTMFPC